MVIHYSPPKDPKFAIICSKQKKCISICSQFSESINIYSPEEADILLCLGGDGFMLHTLHESITLKKPIYGINCGNLGFLMNDFNLQSSINDFISNILQNLIIIKTYPLEVKYFTNSGKEFTSLAFNEAYLLRKDGVASHLKIFIDNELKCSKLVSDGALVSTPIGSLAYNKACGGPIIPLDSKLLILTTINTFEPFHFKGAILPENSTITFEVISSSTRCVNLFCDFIKYEDILRVEIKKSKSKCINLLFHNNNHLKQKISNAQFER